MANKTLTPKQLAFIEAMFGPTARGDVKKAMSEAGYSEYTKTSEVLTIPVMEALQKRVITFLESNTAKAAYSLLDILEGTDDPLGRKERITVAKDFLDRTGFGKVEKVEVSNAGGLFILPAKATSKDAEY